MRPGTSSTLRRPRGAEELLIVNPQEQTVSRLGLAGNEYKHQQRSRLIAPGPAELAKQLDWP
jgi:hypothetical protein